MDVSTRRRVVFATVQLANLLAAGYAAGVRHRGPRAHEGPAARPRCWTRDWPPSRAGYLDDALVISAVLFFGAVLVGFVFVGTVPRVLNLLHHAGQGLPAVRIPLLGPARDRPHDQQQVLTCVCSVTPPTSSTTCVGWATTFAGCGRPVRTSARSSSTTPRSSARSAAERWSRTGCPSSMPTSRTRPSACPGCRSGRRTSWGTGSPIPRRARRATTASSRRRSWFPLDGQVREGVGLLGAPSFEIPRSVKRDKQLDVSSEDELRRRLRAKNVHNTITHGAVPAGAVDPVLRRHRALPGRRRPLGLPGCARVRTGHRRDLRLHRRLQRPGRPAGPAAPGLAAAGLLDLRPRLLAARALLEDFSRSPISTSSTAPR